MDKNTFTQEYDLESKIAHVKKVKDEMTKNHKGKDNEITIGFMPQVFDEDGKPHKMCPVHSFENYINHLNPKIDAFLAVCHQNASSHSTIQIIAYVLLE